MLNSFFDVIIWISWSKSLIEVVVEVVIVGYLYLCFLFEFATDFVPTP